MAFGVYAFGHGGGVPNRAGNTNFALIPELDPQFLTRDIWYTCSQEEVLNRPYWLVDCGPETALRVCGSWPDCEPVTKNLQGVFITHSHDDHSGGLKSLAYYLRFVENRSNLLVLCPPRAHGLVEQQLQELHYLNSTVPEAQRGPEFFFCLQHCDGATQIGDGSKRQYEFFPVDHNLYDEHGAKFPSCGLNVTLPDGRRLVFSGDTAAPVPMHGAAWVVHDTQNYASHDYSQDKQTYVHCPYHLLRDAYMALPEMARPELWITHTGANPPPQAAADGIKLFKGGALRVFT